MTNRPLDGIRVIDFSRVLAGPLIGQLLGDLGADVIKVERPGHGDDTRTWGPPWHQPDDTDEPDATYYLSLNRNKRSIVLDLKDEDDQAFARRLALTGDIVLDNFKPGFTAAIGLDRASLAATRPSIITATITAFGAASDAAHLPGYDLVAQGMGGLMHLTGEADGRPLRVGVPLIDMFSGYNATVGVLAALAEMRVTGVGRHIEVSLYDAALNALLNHQTAVLMAGADPARGGNRHPSIAPYESYTCSDGDIIVAAANNKLFAGLCRVIGRVDLIDDPRFEGNTIRRENVHELNAIINHALATDTRAAWIGRLREQDVPCGPINSLTEAIDWGVEMNMETIVEGDDGYRSVRNPIRIDGQVATQARRPPRLGEHADEIRAEVDEWDAAH
ncbi:MAG: CaiB/BaiF CoA transferase family protein [Acidimicrobiales bacterium]|jgi:crotonobetainyl-CoA:carnitine CoA-transferase CaiB-like acyl-CoA transferase